MTCEAKMTAVERDGEHNLKPRRHVGLSRISYIDFSSAFLRVQFPALEEAGKRPSR